MTTVPKGGDVFEVVTESGSSYSVDIRGKRCTCPDFEHRDDVTQCKHIRRVSFATGERTIPAGIDVDPLIGEHVEGTPHQAVTDGGIIEAPDDGEILDGDDGGEVVVSDDEPHPSTEEDAADGDDVGSNADDGRPEECDCGEWNQSSDLPCWPCYRDGFEEPASTE